MTAPKDTLGTLRVVHAIDAIDAVAWDAASGADDPFSEHAFLSVLEASGSVGPGTGWEPRHLVIEDAAGLVAALPLYRKSHSYGEYIFDFAWANAAHRARVSYYPKLVSMTPLTPATGTRFLVRPGADYEACVAALLNGVVSLVRDERASSAHLLFLDERESDTVSRDDRFLARLSHQYHFVNDGYRDFDDLLSRFRSVARKQIRKERRVVAESGLRIEEKSGDAIDERDWSAIRSFYFDTCARKGSTPYLEPAFFDLARERLAQRAVAVLAYDADEPVAMTLSFEKGACLYGRYWGAKADYDRLHFELCYYRLIDRAIARGYARFEAGAQGEHKIKRGLLPTPIRSSHFLVHPGLRDAVAAFLPHERAGVEQAIGELDVLSPFRRAGDAP